MFFHKRITVVCLVADFLRKKAKNNFLREKLNCRLPFIFPRQKLDSRAEIKNMFKDFNMTPIYAFQLVHSLALQLKWLLRFMMKMSLLYSVVIRMNYENTCEEAENQTELNVSVSLLSFMGEQRKHSEKIFIFMGA